MRETSFVITVTTPPFETPLGSVSNLRYTAIRSALRAWLARTVRYQMASSARTKERAYPCHGRVPDSCQLLGCRYLDRTIHDQSSNPQGAHNWI